MLDFLCGLLKHVSNQALLQHGAPSDFFFAPRSDRLRGVARELIPPFPLLVKCMLAPTGNRFDDRNGLYRLPRDRHRKAARLG